MIPKVVQAVAGQNFSVYAYFHDGTVRLLDALPLIQKGGVFVPLQNSDFFRDRLTVINDTVAWDCLLYTSSHGRRFLSANTAGARR